MRFLRTLAALAVAVCVALIAVAFAAYGSSQSAARERAAVPAKVFEPFGWQASVPKSPPGPATLLVSGQGWGLRGVTFKGKVAVIGESGVYRMQRYTKDVEAGEDVLLSPDGQLIVDATYTVPAGYVTKAETPPAAGDLPLWFTDLTTGRTTRMTVPGDGEVRPVAWSPNGAKLLVEVAAAPTEGPWPGGRLELLDLRTGEVKVAADLGSTLVHRAQLAAFSPNGRLVAVQIDTALVVLDLTTGTRRTLATLSPDQRLAGIGAWSDDGSQIALLTMAGCSLSCTKTELDERRWQISELDAFNGTTSTGEYPTLTGLSVRVLGRLPSGQLAVARYRAYDKLLSDNAGNLEVGSKIVEETDYRAVGGVALLRLEPGGGQHSLVALPDGVSHVDVAADLVRAGRFDGKSPRPMPLPAPAWVWALLIGLLLFVASLYRQVRRGRS